MLSRALVTVVLFAAGALAQSGVVKSNGLPIPGATVTATQGGRKIVTTTDENGRYSFEGLTPGPCVFDVQMFGFRTEHREAQVPGELDWTLQIPQRPDPAAFRARVNQTNQAESELDNEIAAAGTAPPAGASSDSANESFLVQGSLSQGLQNGRADAVLPQGPFGQFGGGPPGGADGLQAGAPGQPGLVQTPGGPTPAAGPGPGGGFGAGGGVGFGGGGGGGGGFGGGRGGGGGFGGGGGRGGQFQGRNRQGGPNGGFFGNRARRGRDTSLHGALFYTVGNSVFNAAPFSFSQGTVPVPQYSSNRFGVTIGGPLQIPKLFKSEKTYFFLNYFGTRASTSAYNVGTVPTAAERGGDFSNLSVNSVPVTLFNPLTGQPFAGNIIPASMFNSASLGLLGYIPLPNQPGSINNYVYSTSVPTNTDNLNVRFMQNITKNDRFAENFNLQDRSGQNPYLFGFLDESNGRGLSSSFSWTHNLGARSLNIATLTFNRNRSTLVPYFANTTDVAAALGIEGVSSNPSNFGPPNLSFTNYASLSDGTPSVNVTQYGSINDNYTLVKGEHTITAGFFYRRTEINVLTDSNGRGTFSFSGVETSQIGANGQPVPNTGYDFADFLLGLPQSSSIRYGDTSTYFRGNQWGAFAQDDWRIKSNLTLLFGVRWEYYSPLSEKYGHISNLVPVTGFGNVACIAPINTSAFTTAQGGPACETAPNGALLNPDKHDFAPRVGIAWKPFAKYSFTIRAGYGVYYNPTVYNQFTSRLAAQYPFANTASLVAGLDSTLVNPACIAGSSCLQTGLLIPPGKITSNWAVDPNYLVGSAQSWTFNIQQNLGKGFFTDIGYIGTKGTHLDIETVPNSAVASSAAVGGGSRQDNLATSYTYESSNANSVYDALQVRVIRRFRRGISLNATYTFSKSIDNSSTFGGVGNTVAQNAYDISAERGLSSFNQTHVLNFSYNFTAPKSNHAWLSDWQLTGGITATSGTPFTARVLGNQSNIGGTGVVGSGRAEATGLPVEISNGFFNLLAFTTPPEGQLGDAGRNTIPGIAQWSWNSAFGRSFRFGETRRAFEFRLEGTNILNHVNFTSIGTVVNSVTYGIPIAAGQMRQFDATLRFRF